MNMKSIWSSDKTYSALGNVLNVGELGDSDASDGENNGDLHFDGSFVLVVRKEGESKRKW